MNLLDRRSSQCLSIYQGHARAGRRSASCQAVYEPDNRTYAVMQFTLPDRLIFRRRANSHAFSGSIDDEGRLRQTAGPGRHDHLRRPARPASRGRRGLGPHEGRGREPDRHLRSRRHGKGRSSQSLHYRLRPGGRGRTVRAGRGAIQARGSRVGQQSRLGRPARLLCRVGSRQRAMAVPHAHRRRRSFGRGRRPGGHHGAPGIVRPREVATGRDPVRQRRHRRCRLDRRANGEGRRRTRHHDRRQ